MDMDIFWGGSKTSLPPPRRPLTQQQQPSDEYCTDFQMSFVSAAQLTDSR